MNELDADKDAGVSQQRVGEQLLAARDKWMDKVCTHLGVTHDALPSLPVEQVAAAITALGKKLDPAKLPEMIRTYCQRKSRAHG